MKKFAIVALIALSATSCEYILWGGYALLVHQKIVRVAEEESNRGTEPFVVVKCNDERCLAAAVDGDETVWLSNKSNEFGVGDTVYLLPPLGL